MTVADKSPRDAPASPESDDAVHVDQAAKALGVSRRTIERMLDRGQLRRDTRHDSRVAMVTKRSLVEVLEARRHDNATRQSQPVSQSSAELAGALEAIERLADTLADERRQLMAAAEDRRQAERDREEARIEAARVQAELAAYREAAAERAQDLAADRDALRAQLDELAGAGPIRALRLRRRLRTRLDG